MLDPVPALRRCPRRGRFVGLVVALGLGLGLVFAPGAPAAAEEAGWSYELANELMSPYCPGRALSECPSPQAAELREWIVAQEREGVARARVEEQLYARFGDQLRQAPRPDGMGLWAYVIPAALAGAGGIVVAFFFAHVRRSRGTAAGPPGSREGSGGTPEALDPELARQVDAELEADLAGEDEDGTAKPDRRAAG